MRGENLTKQTKKQKKISNQVEKCEKLKLKVLYDNISLIMSVLNLTSNCDAMKAKNHIVIFEGVV